MNLENLKANSKNPRVITDEKLRLLEKSLKKFGSLDGFIYNLKTKRLVGGHQRKKIFKAAKIIKVKGTDQGYAIWNGMKFPYREVNWSEEKEKAANIAANKGAGDWDLPKLGEWMLELKGLGNFDLDLTMFDEYERKQFDPIEKFIAEEHWTEDYTPPEKEFKIVIIVDDETKKEEILSKLKIKDVKKYKTRVWSFHYPPV